MRTYRPTESLPKQDTRTIRNLLDYLDRNPRTLQRRIGAWGDETFPRDDTFRALGGLMAHLDDECTELDDALRSYAENTDERSRRLVAEEAADCLILLFQIAHLVGFDLLSAVEDKMIVNMARTWGEPDERGVVRHVETGEVCTCVVEGEGADE